MLYFNWLICKAQHDHDQERDEELINSLIDQMFAPSVSNQVSDLQGAGSGIQKYIPGISFSNRNEKNKRSDDVLMWLFICRSRVIIKRKTVISFQKSHKQVLSLTVVVLLCGSSDHRLHLKMSVKANITLLSDSKEIYFLDTADCKILLKLRGVWDGFGVAVTVGLSPTSFQVWIFTSNVLRDPEKYVNFKWSVKISVWRYMTTKCSLFPPRQYRMHDRVVFAKFDNYVWMKSPSPAFWSFFYYKGL